MLYELPAVRGASLAYGAILSDMILSGSASATCDSVFRQPTISHEAGEFEDNTSTKMSSWVLDIEKMYPVLVSSHEHIVKLKPNIQRRYVVKLKRVPSVFNVVDPY